MITEKGTILSIFVFAVLALNGNLLVSSESWEPLKEYAIMFKTCMEAEDVSSELPDSVAKDIERSFAKVIMDDKNDVVLQEKVRKQITCIYWAINKGNSDAEKYRKMLLTAIYVGYSSSYYAIFLDHQRDTYKGTEEVELKQMAVVMSHIGGHLGSIALLTPYDDLFSKLKEEGLIVDNATVESAHTGIKSMKKKMGKLVRYADDFEEMKVINEFLKKFLSEKCLFPQSMPPTLNDDWNRRLVSEIQSLYDSDRNSPITSERCEVSEFLQKMQEFEKGYQLWRQRRKNN